MVGIVYQRTVEPTCLCNIKDGMTLKKQDTRCADRVTYPADTLESDPSTTPPLYSIAIMVV